jgi:hypothetical protein
LEPIRPNPIIPISIRSSNLWSLVVGRSSLVVTAPAESLASAVDRQ